MLLSNSPYAIDDHCISLGAVLAYSFRENGFSTLYHYMIVLLSINLIPRARIAFFSCTICPKAFSSLTMPMDLRLARLALR